MRFADRRVLGAAALAVLLVALAAVLLLRGGSRNGAGGAPAAAATRLVPARALVYLHLSTDTRRTGTRDAQAVARRFPGFERGLQGLSDRLSAPECGVAVGDVTGKEVALALVDQGSGQAGSLVLVDTGKEQRMPTRTCGAVQVVGIGRFLAVGQPSTLEAAQGLAKGEGSSLAADPRFVKASSGLRTSRVLDGWVSAEGVRRLLTPQGGLLGQVGTLLEQPGLQGAAFGLAAAKEGAKLTVVSELDGKRRPGELAPFTPSLGREVPASALGAFLLPGLSTTSTRLLSVAGASSVTELGPLLGRALTGLAKDVPGLEANLLAPLRHEVAVFVTPAGSATALTLVARARDEAATRATLQRLQAPLARVLTARGKPAPAWTRVGEDFQLRPAAGVELDYGVFGGKLVLSTARSGIEAARALKGRLADDAAYRAAAGGKGPGRVTSLVFLHLSQLLQLGEQSGLIEDATFQAVKDDLRRVRTIGSRSTTDGRQSTAELSLFIP